MKIFLQLPGRVWKRFEPNDSASEHQQSVIGCHEMDVRHFISNV